METDGWHDELHATRLPDHDAPGRLPNSGIEGSPAPDLGDDDRDVSGKGEPLEMSLSSRNRLRLICVLLDGGWRLGNKYVNNSPPFCLPRRDRAPSGLEPAYSCAAPRSTPSVEHTRPRGQPSTHQPCQGRHLR